MKLDEAHAHGAEDIRRLRGFPAFEKFSDAELERLVGAAQHISGSTPWPLIREQTPSEACYILLDGEAGVYVGDNKIATLGPGEVIGESVLRTGKLRSATVTTTGPATVLRIGRDDLARLVDAIPALRETMEETARRHTPAVVEQPPKQKRSKINASVPTELADRFEEAASKAGVDAGAALEAALTQWIERNGG